MASDLAKEILKLFTEMDESQLRSRENYNIMINLMDEFERMRVSYADSIEKLEQKDDHIYKLEKDLEDRDSKIKTLQAELKDARSQVRDQLVENGSLKSDYEDAMKRLRVVNELIKEKQIDVPCLEVMQQPLTRSHSIRTASNGQDMEDDTTSSIDYDRTDDSFDVTTERDVRRSRVFASVARERRSTSLQPRPIVINSKRSRLHDEPYHLPPKRSRDAPKPQLQSSKGPRRLTTRNRSMSENSLVPIPDEGRPRQLGTMAPKTTSNLDLRSTPRSQLKESWTRNALISTRQHTYERVNSYLKFTNCDVCSASINFAAKPAVKCSDCQQIVHVGCKKQLPIPCVPRTMITPMKSNKKESPLYSLTEFCPPSHPMIPGPIIHLVTALEGKGLGTEGIYRVPGAKAQVARTLNELRTSRGIPKLNMQHVEILGDCIKLFLRDLRDPLIPKSSKEEFIRAARKADKAALNTAICDLPQPNRDTLAYLILHWQKVMNLSELNRMPKENIARCVSISVMGQKPLGDLSSAAKETGDCERVLVELLSIPSPYWIRFLGDHAVQPPDVMQQPIETSRADSSMLGPISGDRSGIPDTPRRLKYFPEL